MLLEGESIAAIKNKYKYGYGDRSMPDHSDSEDSDSRRLHDAKHDSGDTSDSDQVTNYLLYIFFTLKFVFVYL